MEAVIEAVAAQLNREAVRDCIARLARGEARRDAAPIGACRFLIDGGISGSRPIGPRPDGDEIQRPAFFRTGGPATTARHFWLGKRRDGAASCRRIARAVLWAG